MKRYALLILCCYALLLLLPLPALGILGGDPLPAPPDSSSAPPLPESSGVETEQAVFKVLDEASGTVYTYSERDFVLYTVAGEMPATYHPEALKAQAVAEEQGYTQVLWPITATGGSRMRPNRIRPCRGLIFPATCRRPFPPSTPPTGSKSDGGTNTTPTTKKCPPRWTR